MADDMIEVLDSATVHQMEKGASSSDRGIERRVVLQTLTKTVDEWVDVFARDPSTATFALEACESFEAHAAALLEVAQAAVSRLKVAEAVPVSDSHA